MSNTGFKLPTTKEQFGTAMKIFYGNAHGGTGPVPRLAVKLVKGVGFTDPCVSDGIKFMEAMKQQTQSAAKTQSGPAGKRLNIAAEAFNAMIEQCKERNKK